MLAKMPVSCIRNAWIQRLALAAALALAPGSSQLPVNAGLERQVVGLMPPSWETWVGFQDLDFGPAQPQTLQTLGKWTRRRELYLSAWFSASQIKYINI